MVDRRLLDLLVCPACRTKVVLEGERLVCQNAACGLRYPVRDDIPIMLIQEAQKGEPAAKDGQAGPGTGNRQPGQGSGNG